jgi:UDP-glucose-4-epimerase GalE
MTQPIPILVAGGAGYIGAQTCKALAQAGYLPVTLDNLVMGHAAAVRWGPFHHGDIRDRELVLRLVREHGVQGAIHFAAHSLVGESVRDPAKYYDNNVAAGVAFTSALIEAGVRALVFSSTAAVYGVPEVSPIPEDHALAPINPYGASKLAFEGALRWLGEAHDLRWTVLRYFNAAGADPDGEVGELHEPETHLIPLLCRAVLGEGPPLTVFGRDYDTADGTPIRDYVHVVDLADAHVRAIGRLLEGGGNLTLNVGAGEGATVLQILAAAQAAIGRPVPHGFGPRRAGDPVSLVADTRRIQAELGWRPLRSDLETMIKDAYRWAERASGVARAKP